MSHGEIAQLVNEKYKVDGWWSQMVTVGYERIKGLRARGQRRDGTYEASKSRTFDVPVTTLFDAWADARVRDRWLDGASVKVRTATAQDGCGSVGPTAASSPSASSRRASRRARCRWRTRSCPTGRADRLKKYWSERLDALSEVLAEEEAEAARQRGSEESLEVPRARLPSG